MKYKLLGLGAAVALIVCAVVAQNYEPPKNRYHQHLESLPKEECTDHGEDLFCTHLPLMSITTDAPIPDPYLYDADGNVVYTDNGHAARNDEMVSSLVQYFDSETENNHLTDSPVVSEQALIRIRGNTSREYDKPGYLLKFKADDLVTNLDVSFSGMTPDNEWALHGPFLDKSLIRNYLCYNLAGEIMDYAPNVRFCELFLNGEYMGLYLIIEKVGFNKDGRIDITRSDPKLASTSYILQADRGATNPVYALSTFANYSYLTAPVGGRSGQLEIVYPGKTLTEEQYEFIESDFSEFEKALFSYDYADAKKGYRNYIDTDSFVDYFLINEFTLNYDSMRFSTYLYKDIGEPLKLCVWDFNSAFDYYGVSVVSPETFGLHNRLWYQYLFKDERFVDQVVERYYELREEYFNEEYLFNYIDETLAYLGPAIDRNFEKWGYSFQSTYNGVSYDFLSPVERNVRSHEEAIAQIKDTISSRIVHMDSNLDRLYSLCHESINKAYNHDKKGAKR